MTLAPHEFIRRFLMHVLPKGFHRIRHYGLLANGNRAENIASARELLAVAPPRSGAGARTTRRAPTSRACCRRPVRAAADACSSSRCSRAVTTPQPSRHRRRGPDQDRHVMSNQRPRPGLTRSQPARPAPPLYQCVPRHLAGPGPHRSRLPEARTTVRQPAVSSQQDRPKGASDGLYPSALAARPHNPHRPEPAAPGARCTP